MERLIGVDLGYGFIKATDGREGFLFPSVVGDGSPYQPLRLATQESDPTDNLRIKVGDQVYHVGTLAVRQSRMAYRSLSTTRAEGNDLLVLFLAALSLFAHEPNTTFSVVTGLPPGRMHLSDEFVRSVKGDHRVVRYRAGNPEELYLRVERATVVPQPLGTYWSQVLDPRGRLPEHQPVPDGRIGIIDVGFRTTDLVTVEGGEYVPEHSRTIPTGLASAYGAIAASLLRDYGVERENHALDEAVISGEISVSGRRVDITGLREQAFAQLATKVLVEIRSTWQVADYDQLWVTGGGGHALQRYLVPQFPQASLIADPLTANSRGYLAWAHYIYGTGGAPWTDRTPVNPQSR
ncbi:plasmid segregation protein ParM [Symbiobacterium terraclitae]|uniref:Plasmid segregation protein ParM n=1 Tax=Symbiobacterium terraclitae TaxID=557451 RepID=A0ABS4JWK5_9FIRM|nr:ParM/StbA family protein [Symbiobacterium terraclitae]MBP2019371.1 plasmid segregation protein ParM [Symbiobacterium terraclitae]